MNIYRVFFNCLPGEHWRACSDVVTASNEAEAVRSVRAKSYGMFIRGPFEAKETTDAPSSCWSPRVAHSPRPAMQGLQGLHGFGDCLTPHCDGGLERGQHSFDDDGFCNYCGTKAG